MLSLTKHREFFDPNQIEPVHIIGCGAIGSHLAIQLTRLGIKHIYLHDFDTVKPHNLANQNFYQYDISFNKTDALADHIGTINPDAIVHTNINGYTEDTKLSGHVFLAVDSIETRQEIVENNKYNQAIKSMMDFRMRLTDAQHYAANWKDKHQVTKLSESMNFTKEEAEEATPTSACNTTLSILPTIWSITSLGVANWINFLKGGELKHIILIDSFHQILDAF